jgi:hypothetical protein
VIIRSVPQSEEHIATIDDVPPGLAIPVVSLGFVGGDTVVDDPWETIHPEKDVELLTRFLRG